MFLEKAKQSQDEVKRYEERTALYYKLDTLFEGVDLSDVQSIFAYVYSGNRAEVDFTLKEDKRDSRLVHAIAQKFGMKFKKVKHWDDASLRYVGTTNCEPLLTELTIEVSGAVPATCKVVETEVALSDEEFEYEQSKALKSVQRTKIVRKIDCGVEEEEVINDGAD